MSDDVIRTVQTETLYATSDEPITIEFKETKGLKRDIHKYTVLSPEQFSGVKEGCTGVTGFRDKSGPLMQWAANMAVEAKANGATDIEAKYAHRTKKEAAGDIGTRVHAWIEQHLHGVDEKYTDDMKASIIGYLEWEAEAKPETEFSERIVYSKQFDYAGKLDWGGVLGGVYGLIDFKTGSHDHEYNSYRKAFTGRERAKSEHFVQNAGYDIPLIEETGKKAEFYGVLYIPVDGKVRYFQTTKVRECQDAFIHTLRAKRGWKQVDSDNEYEEQ